MGIDYKNSGVDIQAGDALVEWLQEDDKSIQSNKTSQMNELQQKLISGIGGFASIFKLDFSDIKKPCIVSSTDGVGTKVKLASHFNSYATIGQDLVAMCVNDLLCTGARPLFFLDYYATSKLDLAVAKDFLAGVRKACAEAECLLVGGETAEMPGVYHEKDFDCAGFVVGVVDEDKIISAQKVSVGDRIIGVESSGFHSNGYSLLRKIYAEELERHRDLLMKPTHLYVKLFKFINSEFDIHGCAHVTGSGIQNIPRMLPKDTKALIKLWDIPAPFLQAQKKANITTEKLLETFNCGIGFCFCLSASEASKAVEKIKMFGYQAQIIGEVVKHSGEATVEVIGLDEK